MTSPRDWSPDRAAAVPALAPDEVHLWRVALGWPADRSATLRVLLSEEERAKADRFYFEVDRNRYIVAHAALRTLLARYQNRVECSAEFLLGANGKPSLPGAAPLRFNLAHSRGLGLIALALDREVGVDLEAIDADTEVEQVAERFFSPQECHALFRLAEVRRREGFFHVWSQKEAYLKGRGDGVTMGLDHFDVAADPALGARLLEDRHDPEAVRRWSLIALEPGGGFRGALAVEGDAPVLRQFEWQ